jgi:hypothetical protein
MKWTELAEVRATLGGFCVLGLWSEVPIPDVIWPWHAAGSLHSSASKVLINASEDWCWGIASLCGLAGLTEVIVT